MEIIRRPIGIINTPFTDPVGMPIQAGNSGHAEGRITLFEEFVPGPVDPAGWQVSCLSTGRFRPCSQRGKRCSATLSSAA
jgi:hypothetical protein